MQSIFDVLGEPRRRDILGLVQARELSAGEIADHFAGVTRPAISQHLKVLAGAGLLRLRRDGTRRYYRIRPEGLGELQAFLDRFWGTQLERLKFSAEAVEREKKRRGRR